MLYSAMILGLVGSLHCAFMCGPLAMLIKPGKLLTGRILYNVGRTVTYMILGGLVGLFGSILHFGVTQQVLSITVGIALLLLVAIPSLQTIFISSIGRATAWVKYKMGFTLKSSGLASAFAAGVFNGFLPCGMVYGALLIALVQPTVAESMAAMGVFGIATMPMLLLVAYSGTAIAKWFPFSISKVQTLVLLALALVMIWRGIYVEVDGGLFPGISSSAVDCEP